MPPPNALQFRRASVALPDELRGPGNLAEMPTELERDIARVDEIWNDGIGRFRGPYLSGASFTAVDAFYAPVVFRIQSYGLEITKAAASYPALLLQLPAMRAWYEAALAETWREPGHEADVAAAGKVRQDLRIPA